MAYQSFFSGSAPAAPAKSGGGYQSFFGLTTAKAPSQADLQVQRTKQTQADAQAKQQKQQQDKQAAQQKSNNSLLGRAKAAGAGMVKDAASTIDKSINTVGAGVSGTVGLATASVQAAKGDKAGAKRTLTATQQDMNERLNKSYLTPAEARKGGTALIKPGAQAVADIAPYAIPVGKTAKGASLLTKAARGAVDNAAVSGGTTLANEATQGRIRDKKTAGETAKSLLTGAVVGAAIPLLHGAVKEGGDAISTKDAKAALTTAKQSALLEKAKAAKSPGDTPPEPRAALDHNTGNALDTVMANVHQPHAVFDAQVADTAAATAADKSAQETAKVAEKATADTQKINKQLELLDAKKKDTEDGKLSNVDQVKIKQLKEQKVEIAKTIAPAAEAPIAQPEQLPSAEAPQPVAVPEAPVAKPVGESLPDTTAERGISKIAASVQQKAVERGLKDTFGEAGGYDKITIADQAEKAVALTKDTERLNRVINGEEKLPDGLRATALITAVEKDPVLSKDPDVINRLSKAEHLTGESSRSAQELRLAAERYEHSPVEAVRQVRKVRTEAIEKKTGKTIAKATTDEVKAIKAEKPKVTKQAWDLFVDGLKC